jgi:hypothetical protein
MRWILNAAVSKKLYVNLFWAMCCMFIKPIKTTWRLVFCRSMYKLSDEINSESDMLGAPFYYEISPIRNAISTH